MFIDIILLLIIVICAMVAIQMKDLLSSIMLLSLYSLVMSLIWTRLNAVDVAFTEAAVGAGITTVLFIAALSRTRRGEEDNGSMSKRISLTSLLVVLVIGALLTYGTLDMPAYGDPNAPANKHVASRYIEHSYQETGVPNFVTAVLASYRGYDTLGEVTVIFTAGMGVILLLRKSARKN
jgi:multicomponent Na+:H+ antiporter subunit B